MLIAPTTHLSILDSLQLGIPFHLSILDSFATLYPFCTYLSYYPIGYLDDSSFKATGTMNEYEKQAPPWMK
jgi:hypothetical protein